MIVPSFLQKYNFARMRSDSVRNLLGLAGFFLELYEIQVIFLIVFCSLFIINSFLSIQSKYFLAQRCAFARSQGFPPCFGANLSDVKRLQIFSRQHGGIGQGKFLGGDRQVVSSIEFLRPIFGIELG